MIDKVSFARREEVVGALHGAFITGSFLVDRRKAKDIDIVVSQLAWKLHIASTPTFKNIGRNQQYVSGVLFTRQENESEDDDYCDSENEMYELVEHYRAGDLNILVIRDVFIPAYRAAASYLEHNPWAYETREARVEIHQKMKAKIRDMLAEGELNA